MSLRHARSVLLLVAILMVSAVGLPSAVAAAAGPQTQANQIVAIASHELGSRYSFAATGPRTFDCSGFVYFVYKQAGLLDKIGGARRTVAGFHHWFASHSTVSRSLATAQPGDLLVWGRNHHAGIYIGNGYAISALVNPWGVTKHPVLRWINLPLTAVLHVNITR